MERKTDPVLWGLFFLSGAAGLIYEVVWIRMMVSTFGATVQAVATVVTAFMAGLALGGWLGGRWADRWKNPLTAYAGLEVGIAVSAALLLPLLGLSEKAYVALYRLFPEREVVGTLARFGLSLAPLVVPTALMGATLPFLSKQAAHRADRIGAEVGTLYSVNILGAVCGAYWAGFEGIGRFGLTVTLAVAASLNLLAAGGALVVRGLWTPAPAPRGQGPVPAGAGSTTPLLWVFFLTGFTSLAFQILWTKALALFVDNTVYSYSAMLITFLAGLGAGGVVWSRWLNWEKDLPFKLAVLQWAIGTFGALTLFIFQGLSFLQRADRFFPGGQGTIAFSLPYFATTVPVMLIPTFLMGVSFPVIVKLVVREVPSLGARLGEAYGINTLGSIAGSLSAGFILLPLCGIQKSLLAVGALNVAVAMSLALRGKSSDLRQRRLAWAGAGIFAAVAVVAALKDRPLILSTPTFREKNYGAEDLLFYKEDPAAVVTVRKTRTGEKLLEINGKSVAGTAYEYENTQKMQGHLPILLSGRARSVLQVGFGSGGSLYAIARHRDVTDIHCVEICRAVMEAAPLFRDQNHDILNEPRLTIIHDDAVNYIRKTDRTYDLIMSDSIHPTYAGNGALYSVDYFEKCRRRLNPGGMMSFWFPMYSLSRDDYRMITRSFLKVFPHAGLWYVNTNVNPYTILVGSPEPLRIDEDRWARSFTPEVAEDLRLIGIDNPLDLMNCFIIAEEDVVRLCGGQGALNTDRHPRIEFSVPRLRTIGRERSWLMNFQDIVKARSSVIPYVLFSTATEASSREGLASRFEATTPLLEGQIAQLAGYRDAALVSYKKSLEKSPPGFGAGARTLIDSLYRERAERLRKERRWEDAIDQYRQGLAFSPSSAKSNNNIATLYMAVGQPREAEAHLKTAIANDPAYLTPKLNLGFLYREQGRKEEAVAMFQEVLRLEPGQGVALRALDEMGAAP